MHKFDDIIPPSRRKESEPLSPAPAVRARRRGRFPYLTVLIVLVVVAASAGSLMYFSSAKITIAPNTVSAAVENTFTVTKESGELPFKVISAQKVATQSMKSTGTKTVTTPASGSITIYNTQGKSQELITNTRFQTSAGLIYRIHQAVTIPAGTAAKPGMKTVTVYADKPGTEYNVGPTSFTIPGFAGKPQATQVYARSTVAMAGGASGTVPSVDTAEEVQVRASLTTALQPDLMKSLEEQVPAGYVLLKGAATTTYQALPAAAAETAGEVEVKQQGTATAVVFPSAALGKVIARSVAGLNYQNEPIELSSTDPLTYAAVGGIPDEDAASFSFSLSGTAPLVYTVDTDRIAAAVAGKTRDAAEVALTNYPEVSQATIVLRPFWKTTFPEDPAAITIVVTKP